VLPAGANRGRSARKEPLIDAVGGGQGGVWLVRMTIGRRSRALARFPWLACLKAVAARFEIAASRGVRYLSLADPILDN